MYKLVFTLFDLMKFNIICTSVEFSFTFVELS
jgi:hypothetical protein